MPKTVFFSWQLDTPPAVGRNFIRKALDEACAQLAADADVAEAHRDVAVDSDTQGVAGQPPIVETIFRKIDAASVFVADVTLIGTRRSGRPTPNPNVLIEYGWALKTLTHERVICVMNESYGEPSFQNLPFDLAHVRWPIRFSLAEDAEDEVRREVRKKLVGLLREALRASLGTLPATSIEATRSFQMVQAKADIARFRATGEALGYDDSRSHFSTANEVFLTEGPAIWLRLMPQTDPGRTWSTFELQPHMIEGGRMNLSPLLHESGGYGTIRGEDGIGLYRSPHGVPEDAPIRTDSVAFAFHTGEVWAVDTARLKLAGNALPFLEPYFAEALDDYRRFLARLGIAPPYRWLAGVTGVKGRHFQFPTAPGQYRLGPGPRCAADTIAAEGTDTEGMTAYQALMPLFKAIFEKCGFPRPAHLTQS